MENLSCNSHKVTISFPIYNVESTIRQSLISALNQSYDNIEILAVDDCGKDNSLKIFNEIVATHPRGSKVRLVKHEKNKGLGAVRNTSISEASGEYIYFMDSDDLLYPNTISHLVELLEKHNVDFVTSSHVENRNGEKIFHRYKETKCVRGRDIQVQQYKGEEVFVYMWNKLIRLDVLRNNGVKCIHPYVEDDMFTYSLLLTSRGYCKCSEVTYEYIVRGDSITKELMSSNLPLKTARIYVDILNRKLQLIAGMKDSEAACLTSVYVLNSAFLRLQQIENSPVITINEKVKLEDEITKLFTFKNLRFSHKILFTTYAIKFVAIMFVICCGKDYRRSCMLHIQRMKS